MIIAVGVIILTAIVVVLSVVVIAHHMITDRQRRLNRERFERASVLLAPALVAGDVRLNEAAKTARSAYGDRAVALVLRRARYDLRGPVSDRITGILTDMGEIAKLRKESQSRRDWRRAMAVRALGECGGAEARHALIEASTDSVGEVRRAAREGLLNDGTVQGVRVAIRSFLADLPRRAGWRRSFYARLAAVRSEELTELIRSGKLDTAEEKLAIEALGDAAQPTALPLALARLQAPEAEMRATAIRVIGKVGGQSEANVVLEALHDTEWFVRAAAARSLEWMLSVSRQVHNDDWERSACAALERSLNDSSWWVRANAARALSRCGSHGIGALLHVTESADRYARDAAVAALAMAPVSRDVRLEIRKKIDSILVSTPSLVPGPQPKGVMA